MKKISRETLFAVGIGISVIIVNSWHVFSEWFANKPDEVFTGIAHYFIDYFLYISHIVQGANGAWFFTNHMYTNEILPPTWIYWFYTILGKLVGFGINAFAAYNGSIIVLSVLLLTLWWFIIRVVIPERPKTQLIAFLFITTASNFPGQGDFWFSPAPALNRLGGVPHQIMQTVLLLLVAVLFASISGVSRPAIRRWGLISLLIIISFLASAASPIQMLLIVAVSAIIFIISFPSGTWKRHLLPCVAIAIPALIGAYLTNTEFARQQILAVAKNWENSQNVSVSIWQFVLAIGPIAIFIPFGIKRYAKKPSLLGLFLGIFSALSFSMFFSPIPKLLGTSPVRWLSPASYGTLPILAALGLEELSRSINHTVLKKIPSVNAFYLLCILYIVMTIPSLTNQIHARLDPLETDHTLGYLNHIPYPMMGAFAVIQNSGTDGVVLTDPSLPYDIVIPVFTNKRSFTGQPVHTLYPQTKDALRARFFMGTMTGAEARQFLKDHTITVILASPGSARVLPEYIFLHQLFQNESATVFSVEQ